MATPNQPPSNGGGGSNVFSRKMGPLPLWGWMGIGLAIALAYAYWKQKTTKPATSTTSAGAATGTTLSSQIPQFVNQVYTNNPPRINNKPTGTVPPPSPGTTNNTPPVYIQVPNGYGAWMNVSFPSTQAMNSFYGALGMTGQNGKFPTGLSPAEITSYVNGYGGTVIGPNNIQGPAGSVYGEPSTVYTGYTGA